MTSLPCSVLPRTLRVILLVLAWASMPMWGVAIAGVWLFGDKGSALATAGATVCSLALFIAFFAGRVDRTIVEPAAERQALIIAVDRLSGTPTQPQRVLRAL